jgi:argininosuccinate lyase
MTVLVSGLVANRERLAEAVADPLLLATDVAEDLVRGGVAFRDAHEQVAASVRDGTFSAATTASESVAARPSPGPGGVREAIAAARGRFGQGR